MATAVESEYRDGVRILRMEFGRANALGPDVCAALSRAMDEDSAPTVLTGEERIFSAGLDLVALDALDRDAMEEFLETFSVMMMNTLTAAYPLVAAVNGHAVAGGCVLAMACDHRIGVSGEYQVGMNEMALGLTLPAVVTEILRGKLTPEYARTVILGGALYTPDEALQVGLLDDLASSPDDAVERACEQARQLHRSPREFAAMKGTLVCPIAERFRDTRAALDRRFLDSWFSEPANETRRRTIERLQKRRSTSGS